MKEYQELLGRVLEIQSKSGHEDRMKKFVKEYLKSLGLKPFGDRKGNIYCHKGDVKKNRPFIVAHLDTVHSINDDVKTFFNGVFYYAFDMADMTQYGVGGDDKVGIWAALAAITEFTDISVAFFVEEEIGCVGSNSANMRNFRKANWMAQLDRRGFADFITSNMASDEFLKDMIPLANAYGMVNTKQGTVTDVSALWRNGAGVSAVNIASGYSFPHSNKEVVSLQDAYNALDLVFAMILQYGDKKYPHAVPKPKKKSKQKNNTNTVGYKMRGSEDGYPSTSSLGDAECKYVKGQIRLWNKFYGCYEWRDYSGNLIVYEGTGMKAQHFSKKADNLRSSLVDPPPFQQAIPMSLTHEAMKTLSGAKTVRNPETLPALPADPKSRWDKEHWDNDQAEIDFHDAEDEYWDHLAEEAAQRDMINQAEDEAFEERENEKAKQWKKKQKQQEKSKGKETIKTYHEYGCDDSDLKYAELNHARKQLDNILFMYSYAFLDFTSGRIPDEIIKNISATLHYDHGETLSHYERIFGIEGMYISADHSGSFSNYRRDDFIMEGDGGNVPF